MAKAPKDTENTETENTEAAQVPAKESATEKKQKTIVFIADKACREGTVFNWIQTAIKTQGTIQENGKPGILWNTLAEYMLNNYKPKTSSNYGAAYVNAYIRGGISEGWLTDNSDKAVDAPPVIETKAPSSSKGKPTEAGMSVLTALKGVIEEDDYKAGNYTKTAADIATLTEKDPKVLTRTINKLVKDGYLESKEDEGTAYFRFTEEGWTAASGE